MTAQVLRYGAGMADRDEAPDERFDAIAEARRQWDQRSLAEPRTMEAATAVVRAQQLVATAVDRALRPLGLTFARYEVLMLLCFSRGGALPITKVGDRLLVHPTGITKLVDKLESQGFVRRQSNPEDRRGVLACITDAGRAVADAGTEAVAAVRFGIDLDDDDLDALAAILQRHRARRR